MQQVKKTATAGANTGGVDRTPREPSLLISVVDVAAMLQCSPRHVYRLADAGKLPRPYKLGALVRWPREQIKDWIANGCPRCRQGGRDD